MPLSNEPHTDGKALDALSCWIRELTGRSCCVGTSLAIRELLRSVLDGPVSHALRFALFLEGWTNANDVGRSIIRHAGTCSSVGIGAEPMSQSCLAILCLMPRRTNRNHRADKQIEDGETMNANGVEPLQGLELLRISLETYDVHLKFDGQNTLQISKPFLVSAQGAQIEIDPSSHAGQLGLLWDCIGATVNSVVWQAQIEIKFSNGISLVIPQSNGERRGALVGPHSSGYGYDEF